jgi:outer membrane protein TolC
MTRRLPALLTMSVLAITPACASNYQTLSGELAAYAPARPYPGLAGHSAAAAASTEPSAVPDAFAAAAQRLQDLATQGELALQHPSAGASFLVPADDTLRALSGAAEDPDVASRALADGFSLQTLEALTLLRNPSVKTRAAEARAALETFGQAEQIDAVLRRYATLNASSMAGLGAMEPAPEFPFPAVLALKGRVIEAEVRGARERLEAARRDAVDAARKAYWELIYAGQAAEVTARMIDLLENLDRSVASRYEAGKTSFQDVIRVRIEREKTREQLRTLTEERANRAAEIRRLLALPSRIAIGTPTPTPVPTAPGAGAQLPEQGKLERIALARRQEVRAADALVDRTERMLEMIKTMTYPGFDLGLTPAPRGPLAPSAGGSGMSAAAAAAAVPAKAASRPFLPGDEAYLSEMRQNIAALGSERESVRAQTILDVRNAWFAADRARREETLYAAKVLGLSQSALESSLQGYASGSVAFSDLLESYTGWLEAHLARLRARADIGVARSGLEAAVGVADLEGLE